MATRKKVTASDNGINIHSDDADYVLTGADILRGRPLQRLEIPELSRNGRPGVVFIRDIPAEAVLGLNTDTTQDNSYIFDLIAQAVVNESGQPLFTVDQAQQLRSISAIVFQRLSKVVMAMTNLSDDGSTEGNVSSGGDPVTSSASPTDSPKS